MLPDEAMYLTCRTTFRPVLFVGWELPMAKLLIDDNKKVMVTMNQEFVTFFAAEILVDNSVCSGWKNGKQSDETTYPVLPLLTIEALVPTKLCGLADHEAQAPMTTFEPLARGRFKKIDSD